MNEYRFQYTKSRDILVVLLSCLAVSVILISMGIFLKLQELLILMIELIAMFSLFHILKKYAISECTGKINNTFVEFNFETTTRVINYSELISYKVYYGKNGPALYLKNDVDNFKIFANDNFCKTDNFKSFCRDLIIKLDDYKNKSNALIIHKGSVFATRGMLSFLVITTLIYILTFFFETKDQRLAIGIGGGLYLLIMWARYSSENKIKDK